MYRLCIVSLCMVLAEGQDLVYCVHADPYVWNEGVVGVAQVLMDKVLLRKRFEN